jgi:hypothetical protein
VYSNPVSEPIQGGRELDESEEGGGEFFIASGNAAEFFDAAKEIFDVMAMFVVTAMEAGRTPPAFSGWNTAAGVLGVQIGAKCIGVETLVGHGTVVPQAAAERGNGVQVRLRARCESDRDRAAMLVDHRREFGVQSTFSSPDSLRELTTPGIGSVLMQFDMRTVQVPQRPFRAPRQSRQQSAP